MARATLARLIDRVRALTYAGTAEYSIGTANYWDADQVQVLLDDHRCDVRGVALTPLPSAPAGLILDFQGPRELEGGSVLWLETTSGATVSSSLYTVDYQRGVVTFTADQVGTAHYLYGRHFDVRAASADLLDAWAAREAGQYDVETPAVKAQRSQKIAQRRLMAASLRGGTDVRMYRGGE